MLSLCVSGTSLHVIRFKCVKFHLKIVPFIQINVVHANKV